MENHERFTVKAFDGEIEVAPIGRNRIRFNCNGPQNVDPAPRVTVNRVALLFDMHVDIDPETGIAKSDRAYEYVRRAGSWSNDEAPLGGHQKLRKWCEQTAAEWWKNHPEQFKAAEVVNLKNRIESEQSSIQEAQATIDKAVRAIADMQDQFDELV